MTLSQDTKIQAIAAIGEQMRQYGISLAELTRALEAGNLSETVSAGKRDMLTRLFSILGGIFVFAGISAYIGMFWNEMNGAMHIIVTLGVGIMLQAVGLIFLSGNRYERAAVALLLIALVMQPGGWFVAINEWFPHGREPRYAVLFVMAVMAVQQGTIFARYRLTLLLGATLCFAYAASFTLLSLLDANENWVMAGMGISAMAVAQFLRRTPQAKLSGLGYFTGGIMFYTGTFDLLRHTPVELLYLSLTCGLIYFSTWVRSTALLTVSTFAMLGYIGYFTEEHFVHSVGWPVALIALGVIFFAIGGLALRIKKHYIAR